MQKNTHIKLISLLMAILVLFLVYIFLPKNKTTDSTILDRDFLNTNNPENEENSAVIHNIIPNQTISSPLIIKGRARGTWFFEASFPIRLLDSSYKEIAVAIAQAKTDWMTTDFVEFETTLNFEKANLQNGFMVFEKDNPSGLLENEQKIYIPIKY